MGGRARLEGNRAVADALARAARPPADDEGRALTHGFHAWPARMHPHTAAALIREVAPAHGAVVDPFMGGGTVVLEAMLAGREAYGGDVNPLAVEVAWARTRRWPDGRAEALVTRARAAVTAARHLRDERQVPAAFRKHEGPWYDPPALAEVWSIAQAVAGEPDAELARMLRVVLSSILVKASRQASDSVTRLDREHRFVPRGRVEQWFVARAEEHARNLTALRAALPPGVPEPRIAQRDARAAAPTLAGRVAAVVTSPPYPGTYDYVEHHRRRYAALGLDPELAERAELGSRREQRALGTEAAAQRFQDDLAAAMGAWRATLAPGGRVLMVIGDGQQPRGVVRALPIVRRAGEAAGLRVVASASQPRRVWGHVGSDQASRKEEHVVALEAADG